MLHFTTAEKASTFLSGNKACQEMNVQNQEYQHFLWTSWWECVLSRTMKKKKEKNKENRTQRMNSLGRKNRIKIKSLKWCKNDSNEFEVRFWSLSTLNLSKQNECNASKFHADKCHANCQPKQKLASGKAKGKHTNKGRFVMLCTCSVIESHVWSCFTQRSP